MLMNNNSSNKEIHHSFYFLQNRNNFGYALEMLGRRRKKARKVKNT